MNNCLVTVLVIDIVVVVTVARLFLWAARHPNEETNDE